MRQLTSSKPMSSPGRAASDKFTPQLMRFLRSNVGSKSTRSRSRSRSRPRSRTPMFFRRKKSSAIVEATQEPSSPKVTCIGQVRVRRSINRRSKNKNNNHSTTKMQPKACKCKCGCGNGYGCTTCKCMRFSLCGLTSCLKRGLRKCGWFCGCSSSSVSHRRDVKDSTSSEDKNSVLQQQLNAVPSRDMETREAYFEKSRMYAAFPLSGGENLDDHVQDEDEENVEVAAPPKNAFLLTRCRSAPYRSSSLACRFWGSPLHGDERESSGDSTTGGSEPEEGERGSRDSAVKTRVDDCEEVSAQHNKEEEKEQEEEDEDDVVGKCEGQKSKRDSQVEEERRPLMLMRCKSEPARSGCEGELDPLTSSFWKNRRLSNTETSCTTTKANPVN